MNDICDWRKSLSPECEESNESPCTGPDLIEFLLKSKISDEVYEEIDRAYIDAILKQKTATDLGTTIDLDRPRKQRLDYRYEVLKTMGKGTFGSVIKAFDHKEQRLVAIKVVHTDVSDSFIENEIKILKYLKSKHYHHTSNVVELLRAFYYESTAYLVFELMWIDLYELLRRNKFKGCSLRLVQKFCFSLLICLNALYKCHIIHGDLKPENIMLKKPGFNSIKVIDFNCSCFENKCLFTYFQSRHYRAPEIILGAPYNAAIDMWSLGCVLAEIHSGKTLLPGENSFDQIALIMELKGIPPKSLLDVSTRVDYYITPKGFPRYCRYDGPAGLVGGLSPSGKYRQPPGTRTLSATLDDGSNPGPDFIDFIDRCLEYDPDIRMKPYEALQHDWMKYPLTD